MKFRFKAIVVFMLAMFLSSPEAYSQKVKKKSVKVKSSSSKKKSSSSKKKSSSSEKSKKEVASKKKKSSDSKYAKSSSKKSSEKKYASSKKKSRERYYALSDSKRKRQEAEDRAYERAIARRDRDERNSDNTTQERAYYASENDNVMRKNYIASNNDVVVRRSYIDDDDSDSDNDGTPSLEGGSGDYIKKRKILAFYNEWRGTRYRLGGTSKSGIDCSSLIQRLYKDKFALYMPRTTGSQATQGRRISSRSSWQPGDLVFFRTGRSTRHVGVYVGGNKFMHSGSSTGVTISEYNQYWQRRFWQARRVLD